MKHCRPFPAALALLAVQATLNGCSDPVPAGQVVASVDGEEVTRRELAAEARASGSIGGTDAAMRGPVLAQLVDRKLLANAARRARLDRTPDYLDGLRRGRESLLAQLLAQQIAADIPAPTPAAIRAYLRDHPWQFASREQFLVDEADLPAGATGSDPRPGRRIWLDSAALDPADAQRLSAAGGDAVPLRDGDRATHAIVLARHPIPVPPERSASAAATALRANAISAALAARVEQERRRAAIRYQTGFGPAAR